MKTLFKCNDEVIVTPRKDDYPDIPYLTDFYAIIVEDFDDGTFLVQDKDDDVYIVKEAQLTINN